MDLSNYLTEIYFRKRTSSEKRQVRLSRMRAHRGTDWKTAKPKKGYKRVRVGRHYIKVRQTQQERTARKKVGYKLGRNAKRLRK